LAEHKKPISSEAVEIEILNIKARTAKEIDFIRSSIFYEFIE
jgi:hypothetical protein